MLRNLLTIFITLVLLNATAKGKKSVPVLSYPATAKTNHTDTYWGTTVEDPYQWLEDDTASATTAWVKEQNKVTFDYLAKIPYREQLKKRFEALYNYTKYSEFKTSGDLVFYKRNDGLQNQPVLYVQYGLNGTPMEFINPNALDIRGLTTASINSFSPDGKYAAVTFSQSGSDWKTIRVYELSSRQPLSDEIKWVKSTSVSWTKDGFYYSRYPQPEKGKELSAKNEYNSVYYHQLGQTQEQDVLIYRDNTDPLTYNTFIVSDNGQYIFFYKFKGTYGNELYWKYINESNDAFRPLFTGYKSQSSVVDVMDGKFMILTDYQAPNKRVVLIDPKNTSEKEWKTIIAEQKEPLEEMAAVGGKLFASYLQNATNKLYQFDEDGKNKKEIALPGLGTISLSDGKRSHKQLLFTYTSFTYPLSLFTYDVNTGYSTLFKKPDLKFDTDVYETKQVWYKSKDGTKVSMFIVHKKGLVLNKQNPTYLYGYGGFNVTETPTFSVSRILFLEQGGVYALPNLRGGGEYGNAWHEAGMLMKKQNVFDDFIAAAEYLIKQKYTHKTKLGIGGGSNGGLLVGACMTQRPDLFQVAIPAVGVMDMLKFQKFTIGYAWVVEYGSSQQSKEMFDYLKGYSPYHNIKPGIKYPATMVLTADHDDRVVPAHSFKFAARLQEYANKQRPSLIRIGVNAGHGAGKPTSKIIEEEADRWSFLLWNVGVKQLNP